MLATRDFHVSALSPDGAHIWILMGIFLWFLCICCLLPHHCFLFSGVGRKFCSIWPSCQTCQSKSLISGLIIPNIPYFFFEMSECRQGLSFFLSVFLLTNLCRTYLCTEKPREDFIHCCAIQSLKRWIIFLTDLHLFDLCSCWHACVKASIVLRCLWAECRAVLCLPKQFTPLSS